MGAPLVGQERLTDSRTIARAVELMEGHIGRKFRGIMSLEIGGGNSIQPLMAAAHLESAPVIDSDMMGARLSRGADDLDGSRPIRSPCPLTTVDVREVSNRSSRGGADLEVDGAGQPQDLRPVRLDRLRPAGKAAHLGAEVKKWGIHGTTTKAIAIGTRRC